MGPVPLVGQNNTYSTKLKQTIDMMQDMQVTLKLLCQQ